MMVLNLTLADWAVVEPLRITRGFAKGFLSKRRLQQSQVKCRGKCGRHIRDGFDEGACGEKHATLGATPGMTRHYFQEGIGNRATRFQSKAQVHRQHACGWLTWPQISARELSLVLKHNRDGITRLPYRQVNMSSEMSLPQRGNFGNHRTTATVLLGGLSPPVFTALTRYSSWPPRGCSLRFIL